MVDHIKQEINGLNKRVYDISSSGESIDEFKELRDAIREKDPELYEYLIFKSAKDKSDLNILRSNYLVILHKSLDIINDMRTNELLLEERIEKLENQIESKRKIEPSIIILYLTGFIMVFWGLHSINPDAGNAVINIFKYIIKIITFGLV